MNPKQWRWGTFGEIDGVHVNGGSGNSNTNGSAIVYSALGRESMLHQSPGYFLVTRQRSTPVRSRFGLVIERANERIRTADLRITSAL